MTAASSDKEKLRQAGSEFAKKQIENMFARSKIVDSSDTFPKFMKEEVKLGKILGKGGFGTVYEVRGLRAEGSVAFGNSNFGSSSLLGMRASISSTKSGPSRSKTPDEEAHEGQMESRKFISDNCIRNGGDARYALKVLSQEVVNDPGQFIQGSIDMAIETRVLSDIEHPNIIKMRACAAMSQYEVNYFIVMDRLYDTMEHRIIKWGKFQKRITGGIGGKLFDRKGEKKLALLEDKLVAAFDLSAAILYLHNRNILYRDLKPENIGFDIRDDVKLFDFGLAKEVQLSDRDTDGLFKLTGMTGSPRYMAPEVALEKPYGFSCDTYSFAILFWEMYACKTPFELYGMKSLRTRVWTGELKRPFVQDCWPAPVKSFLKHAWSQDPKERPTFQNVYKMLKDECVRLRGGDESGLEHSRRRSTFVFTGTSGNPQASASAQKKIMDELKEVDYSDEEEGEELESAV